MSKIRVMLTAAAMLAGTYAAQAQSVNDLLGKANKVLNTATGGKTGNYTNTEAVNALKQALNIGAQNASGKLNSLNGFFGNQLIKILMPPEAKKVESTLRSIGMGKQVDNAILAMNRAAEDAAGKAVPIFTNAITGMSIQDGINIVRGGNNAATNYLKGKTTTQLTDAFKPVISNSLGKVDATKYWSAIFSTYNRLPTTANKINPDLTAYVTERALNGLFVSIAEEENKIRQDPAARVTDLLKKVFGNP